MIKKYEIFEVAKDWTLKYFKFTVDPMEFYVAKTIEDEEYNKTGKKKERYFKIDEYVKAIDIEVDNDDKKIIKEYMFRICESIRLH